MHRYTVGPVFQWAKNHRFSHRLKKRTTLFASIGRRREKLIFGKKLPFTAARLAPTHTHRYPQKRGVVRAKETNLSGTQGPEIQNAYYSHTTA